MVNCHSGNECDNDNNVTWSINAEAAKESDEADKTNNGVKYEDDAEANSNTGTKAVHNIASTATTRCSKREQKDPHEFRDNNDDDDNNKNNDDIAPSVDIVSTKKKKTTSI